MTLVPWKETYDKSRQHIKKQSHHFSDKGPYSQTYGFPISRYGGESWTIKKAECPRVDAFELWCWKNLESPLDYKIKSANPKGNQPVILIGRTDTKTPVLWPPDEKN